MVFLTVNLKRLKYMYVKNINIYFRKTEIIYIFDYVIIILCFYNIIKLIKYFKNEIVFII